MVNRLPSGSPRPVIPKVLSRVQPALLFIDNLRARNFRARKVSELAEHFEAVVSTEKPSRTNNNAVEGSRSLSTLEHLSDNLKRHFVCHDSSRCQIFRS